MTHPPPLLRQLGNYAVASWSSETLLDDWRRLRQVGYSEARIAQLVATMFRQEEEWDTLKAYGPAHPEALAARRRR